MKKTIRIPSIKNDEGKDDFSAEVYLKKAFYGRLTIVNYGHTIVEYTRFNNNDNTNGTTDCYGICEIDLISKKRRFYRSSFTFEQDLDEKEIRSIYEQMESL